MDETPKIATPVKPGAPPVGLYLKLGPDLAMDVLIRDLRAITAVLSASKYERNMHALELRGPVDDPDFREKATLLFAFAKDRGLATIFRRDAKAAKELGADGVLVESPDHIEAAREIFGPDGIIGLACGTSNDLAAQAHDAKVDFVSFGAANGAMPTPEVLRFWTILSDMPAVIEGPVTNDYAAYYVKAGAGFLSASDYIWSHPKGVMQGTVNMMHAIDLALEEQRAIKQ